MRGRGDFYLVSVLGTGTSQFPVVKNVPATAGDVGSIPDLGKSSGEGNGNPFQCSCLQNPRDRGAWRATVHRVAKSQMELNMHAHAGNNCASLDQQLRESVSRSGVSNSL